VNTIATQTVSAVERFGFTLFFATALHAVAIIGITFSSEMERPPQKTIEITLAQHQQKEAPLNADFIAQANQTGSGQSSKKHLPATNQQAAFQDKKIKPQAAQTTTIATATPKPIPELDRPPKPSTKKNDSNSDGKLNKKIVTTTATKNQKSISSPKKQKEKTVTAPAGSSTSLLARSLDIASLQAEIDNHRELRAKQPRVTRLTSASTQKREDALYLDNWRKKIETIGNLHYPEEARRKKMYGSLRLLVAIKPDGSVKTIEILESSGRTVLDDAAIRIVRLGAPFQPFPVEMRKSTDILEIIRTWKFEKRAYVD
tara:strand:- start:13100 stop:14044 length:945 start_codon:yes stop_codon:yes gene_type:complete